MQSGALSRAEVEEKFTVLVGEEIVKSLRSCNWKERLGAMEDLQSRMQELHGNMDASMLIQVVTPLCNEPIMQSALNNDKEIHEHG